MNFEGKVVLVTGANRGIGKSLVEALFKKNVHKIYACSRDLDNLPLNNDVRIFPIKLDILDIDQILQIKDQCRDTQILINNAGSLKQGTILDGSFRSDMETNCFGTIEMMRAFVPILKNNKGSRIINICSIASYVNFPFIAGYSMSKAALYSASQAARIELSKFNIPVHIVNPGAINTDMNKGSKMDMTSPDEVAMSILQDIEKEIDDIIPDKIGREMYEIWKRSAHELEGLAKKMYFTELETTTMRE